MDAPNAVNPSSTEATTAAATAAANPLDPDRPIRILVQTQTHLVPGDKSTDFFERYDAMVSLICQHVWQREYDQFRERVWNHHLHFALDNVECWFLVDHHGPDKSPSPDPPLVWYQWTGAEFVVLNNPLPRKVRREIRHYPFRRVANHILTREHPKRPTPRVYKSRAKEIRIKREILYDTLRSNLTLTEDLLRFVQDCPEPAEWVKARVPPEVWARLEDEIVLLLHPNEGCIRAGSLDRVVRPES
ncbi:hypothetical protein C8A05DRAFT_45412 [Staphylotrichum tortipilum]|uniref:Uncharacterized protein n=1 Tax=Staphylotrichum tortipilum TaxID=2831512 RepID=A0AAN6MH61_9PEZI|nr:hypothetical protein C8A05DRAFT_45412 [Staphylotrichum longicolle]